MLPDRVSNPGPLTYESGALPIALRGPAILHGKQYSLRYDMSAEFPKGGGQVSTFRLESRYLLIYAGETRFFISKCCNQKMKKRNFQK